MPASEAQILANQANSKKSTGPRTPEGKERSRANAYKHGLTGDGIVQPEEDAAEVERLNRVLRSELHPPGEAGGLLVRRIATMVVRMDRAAIQETAALSVHIRQAIDEFEPPAGVDAETAAELRAEAGRRALFDPSKEACLARKYEAAAERAFYRAIKELRQLKLESAVAQPPIQAQAQALAKSQAEAQASQEALGSLLRMEANVARIEARSVKVHANRPVRVPDSFLPIDFGSVGGRVDVPISIGRRR